MGLFDFFTQDIAIDLGTANTLIIHKDKVVVDEPSIIALDRATGKVLAIGREAMRLLLRRLKSPDAASRVVRLRPTLIHRDSCGCGHPNRALA